MRSKKLLGSGGFTKIRDMAEEVEPMISDYKSRESTLKTDGIDIIHKAFEHFLFHRKPFQIFSRKYIVSANVKKLLNIDTTKFYKNSEQNVRNGFNEILELVILRKPEIKKFSSLKEVVMNDGPHELVRVFYHFLYHRKYNEQFTADYVRRKVPGGNTLWQKTYYHLSNNGGFNYVLKKAIEIESQINNYVSFKEVLKIDAPRTIVQIFDYWQNELKSNLKFNTSIFQRNVINDKELKRKAEKLSKNAYKYLGSEGGINYLVQLAAKERPEILSHWSYDERRVSRYKK